MTAAITVCHGNYPAVETGQYVSLMTMVIGKSDQQSLLITYQVLCNITSLLLQGRSLDQRETWRKALDGRNESLHFAKTSR